MTSSFNIGNDYMFGIHLYSLLTNSHERTWTYNLRGTLDNLLSVDTASLLHTKALCGRSIGSVKLIVTRRAYLGMKYVVGPLLSIDTVNLDGLVQDYSISSVLAMQKMQCRFKPSTCLRMELLCEILQKDVLSDIETRSCLSSKVLWKLCYPSTLCARALIVFGRTVSHIICPYL